MIANTSEYVVPNFANGGSAIFNQDMVKAYGLPAGAKKIGAANGYIPNFAKYIYDSDRIPADKNATLKAILASSAKKNLLIAPAGAGKSTLAAGMGTFLTGAADVANATEIDILSGAGRTKDGGLSKNLESIMAAVNASGGKVSYLYTKNLDILSRRAGRTDPSEGDLRSKKQIAGTAYAPLNQFDFMGMVKSKANSFSMVRGAEGFVPNFAEELTKFGASTNQSRYAAMVGEKIPANLETRFVGIEKNGELAVKQNKFENSKFVQFPVIGLPERSSSNINSLEDRIEEFGKSAAVNFASNLTGNAIPKEKVAALNDAKFNPGSLAAFAGTLFEASIGSMLGDKGFADYNAQSIDSAFDIKVNDQLKQTFPSLGGVDYVELKGRKNKQLMDSVAKKIYKVTEGQRAAQKQAVKKANTGAYIKNAYWFVKDGVTYAENDRSVGEDISYSKVNPNSFVLDPKTVRNQKQISTANIRGAAGYIPNFARGGPLEDAIQREMAAGLDPSQIRVTTDGKLKSPSNPNGFAVINTRDEPNGRIPNFAKNEAKIRKEMLGKGTAEGPLVPKGYQIPENSGGYVFDYGVGSAQAAQPAAVNSAEQDSINKSILSTNKLMLAFSGLSIATSTLQSTFKNTDSVIGKVAGSLTQIGATATGYASIGSLAGEAFKGKGGALGKVAGYMGPAGAAIGAGIGVYQVVQEMMDAPRLEREAQAKKKTENLAATGIDPRDQFSILKQDQARIEARRKELESGKVDRAQRQADRLKQSGPYGVGAALPMTEKEKKEELEILALDAERNKNQEKLREIKAQIILSDSRQKREEEKAGKDLIKRVALTTQLNALTEAFADGQNKALLQRTQREADFIKTAATLNNYQKQEEANRLELLSIDDKISDSKKLILESTIKELSKASLATGEQAALDSLRKRIEEGKENLNIEEELNKLKINGNSEAGITIKNALTEARIKENGLKTEKDSLKIKQQSKKEEQERNEINKIALQRINDRVNAEKQLRDTRTSGGRAIEDAKLQTDAITLQNQISKQPFATRGQEAQLARINAKIAEQTEIRSIDRAQQDAQINSFDGLKSSYTEQIKSLGFLTEAQKEGLLTGVASAKTAEELQKTFAKLKGSEYSAGSKSAILQYDTAIRNVNDAEKLSVEQLKNANELRDIQIKQLAERNTYELALINLREKSPAQAGAIRAMSDINKEVMAFSETFSYNTTLGFRDGLRDALSAAVSGTDDLRGALEGVAQGFLKTMQQAFLQQASNSAMQGLSNALPNVFKMPIGKAEGGYIQKFASGGMVTGGSGIRDDVPAMLSAGEYVMRKSAVQKYGAENMAKMNDGGIFLPGVRGGAAISGYDQLSKFANQTTTSGATDVFKGSGSTAFANLEDQSARLSRFGLMNEDTIKGEITSAQQQGLELIAQREAYRTQQRKAMQQQVISTLASAALAYGAGKLGSMGSKVSAQGIKSSGVGVMSSKLGTYGGPMSLGSFTSNVQPAFSPLRSAYGGIIRGFNNGGGPTDDIPALLMGGEYVMNRATTRKYGKQYLDSMNTGRARFADGGEVGGDATVESSDSKAKVDSKTGTAVNININVSGSGSSTESQGQTSQGGVDYKKMGERIKAVVLETINEEKRLGGALRSR